MKTCLSFQIVHAATFINKNILRWKNKIPTKYEKTRSSNKMFRIRTQLVIFPYHLQHRNGVRYLHHMIRFQLI